MRNFGDDYRNNINIIIVIKRCLYHKFVIIKLHSYNTQNSLFLLVFL